ncbi:MAG: hypothetical protein PGN13_02665 [Patulibacter minatonensis]
MTGSTRPALRRATAALTILAAAVPTGASAATTVGVPGKCYVYWPGTGSQEIPVSVNGLTPGQTVKITLEVGGQPVSGIPSTAADASGSITAKLSSWTSGLGEGPTASTKSRVTVEDVATGKELGENRFKVANVAWEIDGKVAALRVKRVWEVSGLAVLSPENTYWAHYFRGAKQVGRQRLGRSTDACGYMKVRRPLAPFRKAGKYEVRVQASSTFDPNSNWISRPLTISR